MSAEKRGRDRRFSRGLADRAVHLALKHREDQAMEAEQSEKLRLVRKKKLENSAVLRVINGNLSGDVPAESQAADGPVTQPPVSMPKQPRSLFSDIDLSSLGALEVYKG
jgi:hypothetical protein